MAVSPFEFVGSINQTKKDIMESEKDYSPFMVNRALSYFPDTVFYAAEMNAMPHLDNRLQYDFLRAAIRPRKRFSKWAKGKESEDIRLVREVYGFTIEKARQALKCLSDEDLEKLRDRQDVGGKQ